MYKGLILSGGLMILCWIWLWFMVTKPEQWSRLVDRENDFWLKRGLISTSLSEWTRRLEKGLLLRFLVGIGAILSTVELLVAFVLILKHAHS
jgi:hypothetical protein